MESKCVLWHRLHSTMFMNPLCGSDTHIVVSLLLSYLQFRWNCRLYDTACAFQANIYSPCVQHCAQSVDEMNQIHEIPRRFSVTEGISTPTSDTLHLSTWITQPEFIAQFTKDSIETNLPRQTWRRQMSKFGFS